MANSCANHVIIAGKESDVREFLSGDCVSDIIPSFLDGPEFTLDSDYASVRFVFESAWRADTASVVELSRRHPAVVVTVAAVELANRYAEAFVYRDGEALGQYEMPGGEVDELAGEAGEEAEVVMELLSTVHAYEADSLAVEPPGPR